jgi:hypothetical protein
MNTKSQQLEEPENVRGAHSLSPSVRDQTLGAGTLVLAHSMRFAKASSVMGSSVPSRSTIPMRLANCLGRSGLTT